MKLNIWSHKKDIWIRKKKLRDKNIAEVYKKKKKKQKKHKLKKTFFKSVC